MEHWTIASIAVRHSLGKNQWKPNSYYMAPNHIQAMAQEMKDSMEPGCVKFRYLSNTEYFLSLYQLQVSATKCAHHKFPTIVQTLGFSSNQPHPNLPGTKPKYCGDIVVWTLKLKYKTLWSCHLQKLLHPLKEVGLHRCRVCPFKIVIGWDDINVIVAVNDGRRY